MNIFVAVNWLICWGAVVDAFKITSNPIQLKTTDPFLSISGYGLGNVTDLSFSPALVKDVDYSLLVNDNFLFLSKLPSKVWSHVGLGDEEKLMLVGATITGDVRTEKESIHVATLSHPDAVAVGNHDRVSRSLMGNHKGFDCDWENGQEMETRMIQLFREANSDNSDKVRTHHYEMMYGVFLAPFRYAKTLHLMEIGVERGASLHMWERLFPKITSVHGVKYIVNERKIHPNKKYEPKVKVSDIVTIYHADQTNQEQLDFIVDDIGGPKLDVIVDDGSHVPWHQVYTFKVLFEKLLAPGGVYIIEDIETSYYDAENAGLYGYEVKDGGVGNKKGSAVEKFKEMVDVVNRRFLLKSSFSVFKEDNNNHFNDIDHQIASITFSRNSIIIRKGDPENGWKQDVLLNGQCPYHNHNMMKDRTSTTEYIAEARKRLTGTPLSHY